MGIFSKLFSGSPSREDLSTISLNISEGLEDVRKTWFNLCVGILQKYLDKKENNSLNIHLGGEADLAIKSYQLYLLSVFLAQHTYILPSESKNFTNILYPQVCGTQIEECFIFFSRYDEVRFASKEQLIRFFSDVANYITNNKAPLADILLTPTFPIFVASNHIVVASCFGDSKMVKKLESNIKKY